MSPTDPAQPDNKSVETHNPSDAKVPSSIPEPSPAAAGESTVSSGGAAPAESVPGGAEGVVETPKTEEVAAVREETRLGEEWGRASGEPMVENGESVRVAPEVERVADVREATRLGEEWGRVPGEAVVEAGESAVETAKVEAAVAVAPMTVIAGPGRECWVSGTLAVLVLAAGAMLMTAHGWLKGKVLAPTDAIKLAAPWGNPHSEYSTPNEQLLDQTVQFVPWNRYTIERFRQGQIPLWNPHSQLGAPFLANGQSAVFYPTTLLHWAMVKPTGDAKAGGTFVEHRLSWAISAAVRVFLAGLGMWLLAGMYGLRGVPRLLTAVSFELCGFAAVWLNHPHMNVMPFLPWSVLVVEALLVRVTLVRVLLGTMVFAVQFLGGHPASTIHLLLACGLVTVGRLIWPLRVAECDAASSTQAACCPVARWVPGMLAVAAMVGLAFALAAAQWLPMMEYAKHSGTQLFRTDKLESLGILNFNPQYLIGLVFPYANGYPPDGYTPFELRQVTKLPNTNELAAGFVGIIPLLLGILGAAMCRRQKTVLMWTIIGALAALIAIGFPGIEHAVRHVPGLKLTQNARMLVVTAMALALLAGFGLETLLAALRSGVDFRRTRKSLFCIAGGLTVISGLMLLGLWIFKGPIHKMGIADAERRYKASEEHEHTLDQIKAQVPRIHTEAMLTCVRLLIPAAILAFAAVILLHASRRAGGGLAATPWPWFAIAVLELLAFGMPYNRGSDVATYLPRAEDVPAIKKLKSLPPARFAGTDRTMLPEMATAYGLSDLRGYDAMTPQGCFRWWERQDIGNPWRRALEYPVRLDNPSHPAWSLLNFGYLMTAPDQPAPAAEKWKLVANTGDAVIYQANTIRPRAWVAAKAEVLEDVDKVLDRVAKMDFDPDQVVLLDRQTSQTYAKVSDVGTSVKVDFLPARKPAESRPEIVRLGVSGTRGGWLVLADSWTPGWEVSIINNVTGIGREYECVPAYGALRAVPLPTNEVVVTGRRGGRGPVGGTILQESDPTGANPGKKFVRLYEGGRVSEEWLAPDALGPAALTVEFVYRPWSWRIGWMTSCMALAVFVLLWGVAMIRKK